MAVFRYPDRHPVAVLVRHGLIPMELGVVHQLFGRAESADGKPLYEVVTCAPEPGDIRTDADFPVRVGRGPEALGEARTVIVPASRDDDEVHATGHLSPATAAALARIGPGTRIASVCTGAFVLAAAGLLKGRPATTHWKSAARFRELFPDVVLDPCVLYTDDGDVLTSAGEAAGIDLCLHMIRRDHGAAVAASLARHTVVPPHREGGQAQYVPRPVPEPRLSSTAPARAWAEERLGRPIALHELAARSSMSVRTFSRRFREETGLTPVQWLTRRRVERARELLEETDLPVDRIAAEAGFGTGASLRQHLRAALGVSPSAYRATFRVP
ncbi:MULTISPECIES: GlxA family transcriptional regulator [Streptomyces]|uniref:Helix-turn-helix domain-containing protein n=2 Tax=Streptomyces TaxID=1883 RepID=A0A3R7HY56_9ACTN|nr:MULTISPECIES: helix-turn-helix domain-containing protein [Streptomyces]KNE80093.1 AraC family transcriptional regulator [Streptomyces fradiae]OFA47372.1 AraC family transcriptional regulator [Streptomyces fradiae]PQM21770.1 AraC family transcriptional regulator [Streptomyces xinghaiensis]RKM93203.1 helix-turn-helix domain-containing protein [Streptomyces xinghaiensis]RNC71199.1 helix-turn-helix domain-containing protein [Streptomyces xinghaiensis]